MRGSLLSHRAILFRADRADDVVYAPLGLSSRPLSAIVYDQAAVDVVGPGNSLKRREVEIQQPVDFTPQRGDKLILHAQNFVVEQVNEQPEVGSVRLTIEKR
jgi:hypothetical protein